MADEPDRCQQTGCEDRATKLTELVRSDNNIRLCDRHYEERVLPNTPETVRVKPYKARL